MKTPRQADAGFTLIETLVALAVLALSSVAFLATTTTHVSRVAGLEHRAAAAWTAENHLVALMLNLGETGEPPAMLGYVFALDVTSTPTADPDLEQQTVRVRDAANGRIMALVTGFRLRLADIVAAP
ncbi:MAG: type II secretion system protein [Rhodobacteraceae bacterium]|nr:type II secretion system protein [Paracoccaceae bacterium]